MSGPKQNLDAPAEQRRAARDACRAAEPDLFFAAVFLPALRRFDAFCAVAVHRQLRQIMFTEPGDGHDQPREPGPCGAGGCEGCADGETLEKRRAVCSAVLEHLYSGQPTGKPELDGFYAAATRRGFDRTLFEQVCDGWAQLLAARRWATWKRLLGALELSGGAAAQIGLRGLVGDASTSLSDVRREQVRAWGSGVVLSRLITQFTDHWRRGRLVFPLDDLVKVGLSEADVSRFAEARSTGGDARWRRLVEAQATRARNLMAGGGKVLGDIEDIGARRAAATADVLLRDDLERFVTAGGDPFVERAGVSWWRRVALLPRAMRAAGRRPPGRH